MGILNAILIGRTFPSSYGGGVHTCEALREKVELLGGFQGILLKFHILKIKILREKIIFFGLDFFPDKILLCSVRK